MTGLILVAVLAVWAYVAQLAARRAGRGARTSFHKFLIVVPVFVLVLVLPVGDELIGAYQFGKLCRKDARRESQFAAIADSIVIVRGSRFQPVAGYLAVNITGRKVIYVDPSSQQPVLEYMDYRAKGGWLIRALHISETNSPLIFPDGCGPSGSESAQNWIDRYRIKTKFER